MKNKLHLIIGTALGLALISSAANAALVLTGSTAGFFQGSSSGSTVVNNAPDGSTASYHTGVPISGSTKSGIDFAGANFAGVQSGDTFSIGMFTYTNGRTQIGSSSATALFDFYLNLTDPALGSILLTTIEFGIGATVNHPSDPDAFTASFTQPAAMQIGGQWVKFSINDLPEMVQVAEDAYVTLAEVTVTYFTPVPEPSTYGLIGAAGLMGLIGYRRFRAQRANAAAAPQLTA
jgi:hypothetical protein